MYDWDYVKCRQCGGTDLAEIKSEIACDDSYSLFQREEQIRKRRSCLAPVLIMEMPLCNVTGVVTGGMDRNKLDSDLHEKLGW